MNLRKEKGYVGIDLATSVIVLMLLIPTIMALVYNLNTCNQDTERKGNAINFATTILEVVKGADFENLETQIMQKNLYKNAQNENILGDNITITEETPLGDENKRIVISKIEDKKQVHYRATIGIKDYIVAEDEDILVKTISVEIEYPLGKNQKKVLLSTVITKY